MANQEQERLRLAYLLISSGNRRTMASPTSAGETMKISSIIAGKKVETISASASVHDLVNSLNTHHVGALVVSGDGKKIDGIVSERDVVRAMPGKERLSKFAESWSSFQVSACRSSTGRALARQLRAQQSRRF